ncbi:MAG: GNAT family N-acetyltransferase [Acidobacteria bacterium]|nr:GNAT family N-acetyltransferase [Acidobacteriota bacterium]
MPVSASPALVQTSRVEPLADAHRGEALAFLAERPLHTVIMAGLLRQHGPAVPAPAGDFYACRDAEGRLEGLALVGRATMFEARHARAVAALAERARRCASVRMIMGEADGLHHFLERYAAGVQPPRLSCRQFFYGFSRPSGDEAAADLRQAAPADLEQIVAAHARMCLEETGVDPLAEDPEGFRRRCASRVERGKVWTLIERGELIFKAEVLTETPAATYVEGVWVSPAHRFKGHGRRCWAALSRALLERAPTFCGFVNAKNAAALNFYEGVGGIAFGAYDKVYL